jgi:SAM-dependent methyltransferase
MGGPKNPIKQHAKSLFEKLKSPWPEGDRWSAHTRTAIAALVAKHAFDNNNANYCPLLLNVGSHGNAYEIQGVYHFHTDIAEEPLRNVTLACVADAERLPFEDETFDFVLCVGSVINYCVAAQAIVELARVLKSGGRLLLEFETSDSFEFALTNDLGKDVTIVRTFYNGTFESIYVYSERYIAGAMKANDLSIVSSERFHFVSPLMYRISRNERIAAAFSILDSTASKLPFFKNYSANIFVTAQKAY